MDRLSIKCVQAVRSVWTHMGITSVFPRLTYNTAEVLCTKCVLSPLFPLLFPSDFYHYDTCLVDVFSQSSTIPTVTTTLYKQIKETILVDWVMV
jgi:hypothetical protein